MTDPMNVDGLDSPWPDLDDAIPYREADELHDAQMSRYADDDHDAADAYASLPAWRRWLVDWRQARSARRFRRRLRTSHHLNERTD